MTYYKVKAQSLYQSDQLLKCFIVPLKSVFSRELKTSKKYSSYIIKILINNNFLAYFHSEGLFTDCNLILRKI